MKGLLKVLLVEDNDFSAKITHNMLEESVMHQYVEYKFEVNHVCSLKNAVKALSNKYFDIVVLDLNLPDSTGIQTLQSISKQFPDIPIIVLSATDDFKLSYDTIKSGAQDYLVKGKFDMNTLIRSIYYSIERFKMMAALKQLALLDDLTGLFNRRAFMNLAEHQMKIAKRKKINIFFVFCDLDDLKIINDTYGHAEGDSVLIEFAGVLKKSFRESDIIARYAGDEFIVLAVDVDEKDQGLIRNRLKNNLEIKNSELDKPYKISASVGSSLNKPDSFETIYDIIKQVDICMYEEKKNKCAKGDGSF